MDGVSNGRPDPCEEKVAHIIAAADGDGEIRMRGLAKA